MKILIGALILPAVIVLGIAAFETRIFYPVPSNGPTRGIVWAGHTFATRTDFARWLRSRGVPYRVWARRHPIRAGLTPNRLAKQAVVYRKREARDGRQKDSGWGLRAIGGGAAFLAVLGLGVVFVRRRRRPGSLGSARQPFRPAADRAAPVARRGTGPMLRRAKATAVLSSNMAESLAKTISREGTEFARSFAHRAAPPAKRGAGLALSLATSAALVSSSLAASSAKTISRRRGEFAWYLASALLAAGIGVVATVWLNQG
jgi:MYXO-CTERM domain-containing protein